MRTESYDRLSIANGCSRDVVTCFLQSEKKGENFRKKGKAGILSQKMLFPPRVVVDFFFDEEERRYAITRRQRKEHKKGRNSPAQVKTLRTRTPFVRSFPALFIHSICHAGGEIQKRSICISKTERKQTMKKSAPTLPPTIIDRGLSMIAMRVTFSRACAGARKKK